MKMDEEDEDEDEDEDDDDEDEDDDEDDESEEEESPVKAKPTPSKQGPAQNGKSPKPSIPAAKQEKTPKGKGEKSPKTPPTPKGNVTLPEIKAKLMEAVKKGIALPKVQPRFENFLKHGHKVTDAKVIAELWKWRQTVKDANNSLSSFIISFYDLFVPIAPLKPSEAKLCASLIINSKPSPSPPTVLYEETRGMVMWLPPPPPSH